MTARTEGRVPPHNLDAEESLLGSMMLSREAILTSIEEKVDPGDFYNPNHGLIFEAIHAVYAQGGVSDAVALAEQLRRTGALAQLGGRKGLLKMMGQTPASANAEHYARIVRDLALLRRLIVAGGEVAELGYDDSPGPVREQLDRAEAIVFEVADRGITHHAVPLASAVTETIEELDGDAVDVIGVRTGYEDFDKLLLGLQPGTMNVVAGRPGMGKTSFMLGAAKTVAIESRRPTLVFSMEMGTRELTKRLLAQECRVGLRSIMRRDLSKDDWSRLSNGVARIADAPLLIVDNPHCTVMEIAAQARRTKAKVGDLGLVVVDYVQLMESSGRRNDNREREVAEFSRALKVLALDLECPILVGAQLNRQLETRNDKRPMLSDLRETGALENDADVVVFLYRDEIYNPESDARGTAEVIVAKHRNGPTGVTRLAYLEHFTLFANMARD